MGSGKRASMREGPLAALFRKTETEGLQGPPVAEEDAPVPERVTPTPQERLRHAEPHRTMVKMLELEKLFA